MVRTPEGAVAARTIHRLSEGQKCDTEFMGRVNGAWDFKTEAGDDVNDGGILERADARPPDPQIEIPPSINVMRMFLRKVDVEKYDPTNGPGCQSVTRGDCALMHRGHTP